MDVERFHLTGRVFAWDESKRRANVAKHGVDFAVAILIFENAVVERIDPRQIYGEVRMISLGLVDGESYVVVPTARGEKTRVISAWKGGRNGKAIFDKAFSDRSAAAKGSR